MQKRQFRQGDVLLEPVGVIPDGLTVVAKVEGKVILAYGEATGHHHAIEDPQVELYTDKEGNLWLHTGEDVYLTHQEHDTVTIPPGGYRVVKQKEYTPEAIRNVAD